MLVLGGEGQNGITGAASIVDPRTGQSTSLPTSLTIPRADHTATVLPDGSVLVIGGRTKDGLAAIPELFDPATQTFSTVAMAGGAFRSGHTATLLTDGRVLVAGGSTADGKPPGSEVWDLNAHTPAPIPAPIDRQGHTATLLGDGRVLIEGGRGSDAQPVEVSSIVDPAAMTVVESRGPWPQDETLVLAASSPASDARDVPLDARIALRFSDALRADTITEQTLVLSGPDGVVRTNVVVAEHGRLAFVWPLDPLGEEQTYTLAISGAVSDRGMAIVPATITFTTVAGETGADAVDAEAWRPGTDKDGWRSGRGPSPWETLAPLRAPDGVTAVSGRVLRLDGRPLADVTLEIEGHETETDRTGRFLLRVEGLATGEHTLEIDARTANKPHRTYGFYEARIIVRAGGTNVLPFTIWSPLIDTAHQVTIASPTLRETLITTPVIPGLELHLPAGTVIRDEEGRVARTVSITPVPLDRTPFPLPEDATFSMFFTIQPGGAYLHTPGPIKGGWLVYPRIGQSPPGKRVQFFDYDPDDKGWYAYGMGTVTTTQVVPDVKTRIYAFTGASFNDGGTPPPPGPPPGDCCGNGADPVNLTTGIFTYEMTDLAVQDVMPLAWTRTYRSQDVDPSSPRAFGIGMTMPYSIFLHSEVAYQEADLILPDGGRVHYVKTPESGANWWQTIFEHTTSPTGFYKSRIAFWGTIAGIGGWELKEKDGTVYVFGHQAPLQAIRDRNGNEVRLTWSDVSAYGSGKGNLLRVTSPNGRWIAFTYYAGTGLVQTASDNIGRTVNYTYNANSQLWKVTDPLNHVTEYTYDANYRMTKIKNRNGVEYVTNEYTTAPDAPTPVGWVKKQTHADGGVYEFTYNVVNGKSTRTDVADPRGYTRRVEFNPAGYTLSDLRGVGEPEGTERSLDRQADSNLITASMNNGIETITDYDLLGRVVLVTRRAGTENVTTSYTYEPVFNQIASVTNSLNHTRSFNYDGRGNLTSYTDPLQHTTLSQYNSAGQPISVTDALGKSVYFTYQSGNLVKVTNPLGFETTRFLDGVGRVVSTTDELGHISRYDYDALGRAEHIVDSVGGITTISYHPGGQIQSITDARNNTTTYAYDPMGRLASRTDPVQGVQTYTYDGNGNRTQQIDRKGQVTAMAYDAVDRLTSIVYADGASVSYTYDARGQLMTIADSGAGSIVRDYDGLGRLRSETTPQGSVAYTQDGANRRATMTVAGLPTVSYGYDAADRLTEVTQNSISVTMSYDDVDRRSTLTLPNGIVVTYGYDDASRLTDLTYLQGAATLGTVTYEYDAAGHRTHVGGTWGRTGLPQAVVSNTYDAANRLIGRNGQTFSYDANGNLVSDGSTSYIWDARDDLASLTGGVTAAFQYDGFGRRTSKTANGVSANLIYDGWAVAGELVSGALISNTVTTLGADDYLWRTEGGTPRYPLADGLGSILALTDSDGALQTQYSYEPYGTPSVSGGLTSSALQFTGRESESNELMYYRSRYYQSIAGRFISEDPIEFDGGINLYAYAGSSPTNFVDPFGLCALSQDMTDCLEELFRKPVDDVVIVDKPKKNPRVLAITGRNKITIHISCDEFATDHLMVLEEYFHVINQWNTGRLNTFKYGMASLRHPLHPYRDNKYEVEAQKFAADKLKGFEDCLQCPPHKK